MQQSDAIRQEALVIDDAVLALVVGTSVTCQGKFAVKSLAGIDGNVPTMGWPVGCSTLPGGTGSGIPRASVQGQTAGGK
jgi:hypothetical protein